MHALIRGTGHNLCTLVDSLNEFVEFDAPFTVHEDGSVSDAPNVYAPSVYDDEIDSSDWEFVSAGYTGQYGYNGPVMHPSETLSGALARDILASPGTYCVVACEITECEDCEGSDVPDLCDCAGDHFPAGWAVVRFV